MIGALGRLELERPDSWLLAADILVLAALCAGAIERRDWDDLGSFLAGPLPKSWTCSGERPLIGEILERWRLLSPVSDEDLACLVAERADSLSATEKRRVIRAVGEALAGDAGATGPYREPALAADAARILGVVVEALSGEQRS